MVKIRHLFIFTGLLAGLVIAGVSLTFLIIANARPSQKDLENWSYFYAARKFHLRSGQAEVVAVKILNTAGLIANGVTTNGTSAIPDLPLGLVIIKGDFDDDAIPGFHMTAQPEPFRYAGMINDLEPNMHGPKMIMLSLDGSDFKKILNDPSLPDPATPALK